MVEFSATFELLMWISVNYIEIMQLIAYCNMFFSVMPGTAE